MLKTSRLCLVSSGVKRQLSSSSNTYDVAIVGGGIVGLAAAQEVVHRYPGRRVVLLEKESHLATHQSGHNSGVVHAGLYYKPGSLTAQLCLEGLHSTYAYCRAHNVPFNKCGKIVVATDKSQMPALEALYARAQTNNVPDLQLLKGLEAIQKYEPAILGVAAIRSPHTGIVDWADVARCYGKHFERAGGEVRVNFEVENFVENKDNNEYPLSIVNKEGQGITASYALVCAGLYSDRLAKRGGGSDVPHILPFRGEYLVLSEEKSKLINGNIYPLPDPRFPFLGCHFTPRLDGEVWLGPNAVLALSREGYKWGDINIRDIKEVLKYPGFQALALRYVSFGSKEMIRSFFKSLTVRQLRRFMPSLRVQDVRRGPTGVRAMAVALDGTLTPEFSFDVVDSDDFRSRILHCRNAPSPAATSSLAIARRLVDRMQSQFDWPKKEWAKLY